MAYTYHPFPIIRAMKTALMALFVVVVIFLARDTLDTYTTPLTLFVIAFGILSILSTFALASTYSITLDDTSIRYKFGVLTRAEYNLPYSKITEARFFQGVFEQLLSLGTLTLDTAGYTDIPVRIREIRMTDIRKTLDAIDAQNKKP